MRGAVVVVGLVGALVGALLDRRGAAIWLDTGGLVGLRTLASLLIVGGAVLTLTRSRTGRTVGALIATLGVVPLCVATTEAVVTGLPGPSTPVLAVGLGVAWLGAVTRVLGHDGEPRQARRRLVVGGLAAVLVAAVAVPAALLVDDLAVRSSTAGPVTVAATPERPTGSAWRRTSLGEVRDVRAAGAGVVVATASGLLALDGSTGADRWRFDRAGASIGALAVSPDGASVAVVHRSPAAEAPVLTVLDAMTGAPRWDSPVDGSGEGPDLLLTDTTVATAEPLPDDGGPRSYRLVARSLGTGQVRWTWNPPDGCVHLVLRPQTLSGVVPVTTDCDDDVVRGLADDDGRELWATVVGRPGPDGYRQGPGLPPASAPDGSALVVSTDDGLALLDPATGRLLAPLPPGFPQPLTAGPVLVGDGAVTAAVDPGTGAVAPVPPGCPDELAAGATGRSIVRICVVGGLDVQIDGGPLLGAALASLPRGRSVALDALREEFVVPAPGAVVVAVASDQGTVVGLR